VTRRLAHPAAALRDHVGVEDRLRASLSGVLGCWAAFATALFAFAITTNHAAFGFAGDQQPVLAAARLAIEIFAVAATLSSVVGAAPLIRRSLTQARREPTMRHIIALPLLAGIVFVVATGLLAVLSEVVSDHGRAVTAPHAVGVLWALIGLICVGVGVVGCRRALYATPISRSRLVYSLVCVGCISMAMLAITLATAIYAIALPLDAPRTASSLAGPLRATTVSVSVNIQVAIMLITSTLATITTVRGWRATRAPKPLRHRAISA
jgi:hypothetical protein